MKNLLFYFIVLVIGLSACTNDNGELADKHQQMDSLSEVIKADSDTIIPLELTDSLRLLKKIYLSIFPNNIISDSNTRSINDEYFEENILAIRELPVTIKVRTVGSGCNPNYCYLSCTGFGKEVILSNISNNLASKFYIKILPSYYGIPYLIYSSATKTPLCVGQRSRNSNDKFLITAKKDDYTLYGASWNLLSTNRSGYFTIQSNDYLGKEDPNNNMSVFGYVLEASKNSRIGFSKRVQDKAQQEFLITPQVKFTMSNIEFDIARSTVSNAEDYVKTVNYTNENDYPDEKSESVYCIPDETSYFNENPSNIKFDFTSSDLIANCPQYVANNVVLLNDKPNNIVYTKYTKNLTRGFSYPIKIMMRENCLARVSIRFKKFKISVPYVVSATCNDRTIKISGTWHGVIIAPPQQLSPTLEVRFFDLETGVPIN